MLQVVQALHKPTGQVRALKRVFLRQGRLETPNNLHREYQSLQSINSPNVVRLLDHFQQVMLRTAFTLVAVAVVEQA